MTGARSRDWRDMCRVRHDCRVVSSHRSQSPPYGALALIGLGGLFAGVTGPRQVPLSIPAHDPARGNGDGQAAHFATIASTTLPVHFVWGAMDLACTRFSGRAAPEHPGGAPELLEREEFVG